MSSPGPGICIHVGWWWGLVSTSWGALPCSLDLEKGGRAQAEGSQPPKKGHSGEARGLGRCGCGTGRHELQDQTRQDWDRRAAGQSRGRELGVSWQAPQDAGRPTGAAALTINTRWGQCCGTWEVETACYSTAYSAQDAPSLRLSKIMWGSGTPCHCHVFFIQQPWHQDIRVVTPPPWAQLGKGALALQPPLLPHLRSLAEPRALESHPGVPRCC